MEIKKTIRQLLCTHNSRRSDYEQQRNKHIVISVKTLEVCTDCGKVLYKKK